MGAKFLQHPVSLERWLMEGSYSKVWRLSRQDPRTEEYRFFVDLLMDMIRNEIASCEEKAYDSLALHDAATLLFFENLDQVLGFAKTVCTTLLPSLLASLRYLSKLTLTFERVETNTDMKTFSSKRINAVATTARLASEPNNTSGQLHRHQRKRQLGHRHPKESYHR